MVIHLSHTAASESVMQTTFTSVPSLNVLHICIWTFVPNYEPTGKTCSYHFISCDRWRKIRNKSLASRGPLACPGVRASCADPLVAVKPALETGTAAQCPAATFHLSPIVHPAGWERTRLLPRMLLADGC